MSYDSRWSVYSRKSAKVCRAFSMYCTCMRLTRRCTYNTCLQYYDKVDVAAVCALYTQYVLGSNGSRRKVPVVSHSCTPYTWLCSCCPLVVSDARAAATGHRIAFQCTPRLLAGCSCRSSSSALARKCQLARSRTLTVSISSAQCTRKISMSTCQRSAPLRFQRTKLQGPASEKRTWKDALVCVRVCATDVRV
jgi:hypothetical protein